MLDGDPITKKRWQRRKDDRPQEVLAAAFQVFTEKGYAAARLDDIARQAGVSKGTVYLYFDSKEAVFQAMVRQAADAKFELANALIAQHEGSQAELIRKIVRIGGSLLTGPPLIHFPRLLLGECGRFPELAAFYYKTVLSRGRSLMMGIIERGQKSGEFRAIDPRHAVHLLMSPVLFMAIYQSAFSAHEGALFDAHGHLEAHLDVYLRGLAAGQAIA
jgi:AcrR family transcriptional regulator